MRLHRTGNWESRKSRTIAVWVQLENALAGGPKKKRRKKTLPGQLFVTSRKVHSI